MNRSPIFRTLLLCLVLVVGLAVAQAALAQSDTLLINPGFEDPFEPVPENPNSLVAQGWTAWFVEDEQNFQPEYYPASDTTNGMATPRIHGGSDAQQYFTFFASHDGGVYQQVGGLTAGDQLEFSIYAYVWASSGENADVSDGSGDLAVQVGIDPAGGTDAESESIVWSNPLSVVDQYAQHSVTATAAGDTVTVFVRSTVSQVAMNNVVYLDDAELVVTGSEAVATPEVTITEEVTEEAPVIAVTPQVEAPTDVPTEAPTVELPTEVPTEAPTVAIPTEAPSETSVPTEAPTEVIPTDVPTEAGTATDVPPTVPPLPSPTLDTVAFPLLFPYTVQRGDTVGQLATRFGSTIEAIIIANQLGGDARIIETQTLMIPVATLPQPTLPPTATLIPSATPIPTETPLVVLPAPTEAPVIVQPVATQDAGAQNLVAQGTTPYIVRYGDTLSSIAARFRLTTRQLAQVNGIVNPNLIYVGQVLQIPVPGGPTPVVPTLPPTVTRVPPTPTTIPQQNLYRVLPGDNLYRISIRFNVPIVALIQINGIADPSRIFVGQILIIP